MKLNGFIKYMLQAPDDDNKGGGGKGGDDDKSKDDKISALESKVDKLIEALTKKGKAPVNDEDDDQDDDDSDDEDDDQDLRSKAKRNRDKQDKGNQNSKDLEAALKFSLGSKDWLKTHGSLLPKSVEDIFATAEKETYDSAIEKDSAIKSGIIQEFFSLQANVDLLTAGPKSQLDDYLKLTSRGKAEKARQVFDNVFEPAFAMLKSLKKADQLRNGGFDSSDSEKAYKEKLLKLSNKHYLGVKE